MAFFNAIFCVLILKIDTINYDSKVKFNLWLRFQTFVNTYLNNSKVNTPPHLSKAVIGLPPFPIESIKKQAISIHTPSFRCRIMEF